MSASRPARLSERLRRSRRGQLRAAGGEASKLDDFVVITGVSGAGKSSAMAVFEDGGYFCVDNLPPEMIASLADLLGHEGSNVERAAVVCDARGGALFDGLIEAVDRMERHGLPHRLVFLDADEQTLLNRFRETRRRHPLAPSGTVAEGIAAERALLQPLRERADHVIETTGLNAAMLRRRLADDLLSGRPQERLAVTFTSFGYKHGPLREADLAFDVRFLPNPHYEPSLRELTGHDERVVEYIRDGGALDELYGHLVPLLDHLLRQYAREGRSHLVVAIGCTGGRHRSVAIAEHLAAHYREAGGDYAVAVNHRDVERRPRE